MRTDTPHYRYCRRPDDISEAVDVELMPAVEAEMEHNDFSNQVKREEPALKALLPQRLRLL